MANNNTSSTWSLTWENLSYVIPAKKKEEADKVILSGMNGAVHAGETVAILGGSGAGKSSLLNCISGRLSMGKLYGQIHLNGHDRDSRKWKKTVSYVEQVSWGYLIFYLGRSHVYESDRV
jgi:ABC-type multidrug transport system ATPase subunit